MSHTAATGNSGAPAPLQDPDLWELTRAAVRGAAAAADEYLAGGQWCPRLCLPSVRAFDSGWPNISRSTFAPKGAPVHHSALFGASRDQFKPFAYGDVPELAALLSHVRTREKLRARLSPAWATNRDEFVDQIIDFEAADLPLSLLDRARATGATTDDDLLGLYRERERAWLADPLPVEYVIPLALTALDLDEPLLIDATTRIERLEPPTQSARAPDAFSTVGSVPDPVLGAATHAIVLSGHQLANPGPAQRMFGRTEGAPPLADADLVCEALRVVTHIDVGYAQVLRRPLGWADRWEYDLPPLTRMATLRRYPERFDHHGWLLEPNAVDQDALHRLPAVVAGLREASSNVRLAARRLSLAALRDADDDRTVDACIGLEALLGEGRDELSHRISLRAATALATRPNNPADSQTVYKMMKKVYGHRSAVVHGTPPKKPRTVQAHGQTWGAADVAVILLRELLTDALSRPGRWTAKTLDSILLAALAPRPDASEVDVAEASNPANGTTKS